MASYSGFGLWTHPGFVQFAKDYLGFDPNDEKRHVVACDIHIRGGDIVTYKIEYIAKTADTAKIAPVLRVHSEVDHG